MINNRAILIAALIPVAAISSHASVAPLTDADRAWIAQCIADRRGNPDHPNRLQIYCTCMQEVVDDNRLFGVTELERSYPPAHRHCWKKAGLRPG